MCNLYVSGGVGNKGIFKILKWDMFIFECFLKVGFNFLCLYIKCMNNDCFKIV